MVLPTAVIIDFCSSLIAQWRAEDIVYHKVLILLGKFSWGNVALEKGSAGCLGGMGNEESEDSLLWLGLVQRHGEYCGGYHEFWVLELKRDTSCNPLGLRLTCCWICCRLKWWQMKKRSFNSIFRPNRKKNWTVSWSPRRENINSVKSSWKR